jgi:hypothetical protein
VTLRKVRQYLTNHYIWLDILHLPEKVFRAVVDTHVLVFEKSFIENKEPESVPVHVRRGRDMLLSHELAWHDIPKNGDPINIVADKSMQKLALKITTSLVLDEVCTTTQGTKPFQVGKGKPPQTRETVDLKNFVSTEKRNDTFRPLLRGSLINKYKILWNNDYWISFGEWLAEPRHSASYEAPEKIIIRQTGDSLVATLDIEQFVVRDNLYTIVIKEGQHIELKYILGTINSRLMNWYYQTIINPEKGEALAQVKRNHIAQLPIRPIDFSNPTDKVGHDSMVQLVEQVLGLQTQLHKAKTGHEQTLIQRQIDATDRQIDMLVYELFGLTEEEIAVVEG